MPQADPADRFRAHKHYVEAFACVGGNRMGVRNDIALATLASNVSGLLSDRPPATAIDQAQVHKSLRNAWSTEVLLSLPGTWAEDEDEFVRIANSWGVVQAYYVGYHETQALWVAKGNVRPQNHPKTQQLYTNLWVDRALEVPPWTFGVCDGGWKNLPAGVVIDSTVHPWNNCSRSTAWSLAAQALRKPRADAVDAQMSQKRDEGMRIRKRAWEAEEQTRLSSGRPPRVRPKFSRPHLSPADKAAINANVRTYTFLDYLYRLRIGANYDDAAIYTDGPDNETESVLLHKRMTFLVSGLALITEMRIRDLVGAAQLYRWADDFISTSIPAAHSLGIKERRPLL